MSLSKISKNNEMESKTDSILPFTEPYWYGDFASPYYKNSHVAWKEFVERFVKKEIMPFVQTWEDQLCIPREVYKKAGEGNILAAISGHLWPVEYAGKSPVEDFDAFHSLITIDEISKCGSGGVTWGLITGLMIGLPPVLNFGSPYLKDKVVNDVLKGEKIICLCISEPTAASDVAAIRTTAVERRDNFIVNGSKKWITNGMFADFFTTAVRTGNAKESALSLLLIEKSMPGVHVQQMKCQGVFSSGTAFVTFRNVVVPKKNLIGREGNGFKMIMHNFNYERWGIIVQSNRLARVAFSDALKYSVERKTFGKTLIDHQVLRFKLSNMARMIESVHAWTELVTFQWKNFDEKYKHDEKRYEKWMKEIGDKIALLKVQSTKTLEKVARESLHVMGGAGYTKTGKGSTIERIYRDSQAFSIPAGSEEIMLDYAGRMMQKRAVAIVSKY